MRITTPDQYLVLIFAIFTLAVNIPHATEMVNVSVEHPVYDFIDRMVVREVIMELPTKALPLTRGEVAHLLKQISDTVDAGEARLTGQEKARLKDLLILFTDRDKSHFLQAKGEDYDFCFDLDSSQEITILKGKVEAFASSLRPAIMGSINGDMAFATNTPSHVVVGEQEYYPYHPETSYRYSENVRGIPLINAYMKFKLPWFELQLGKDNLWWGPGCYGALLISDNSPSWDMLKLSTSYSKFHFAYFTAVLRSELGDRFLSGHRLEALITPKFRFGIHEVVVYGNRFELHYLNPVTVYFFATPALEASGVNDNMLPGLDFELLLLKNLKLYGELVVDDFQTPWDPRDIYNWANLFGILAGIYCTNPLGLDNTDLRVEYTFINQFCYTHSIPINRYENHDYVIGHWLGPDSDYFKCDINRYFTDRISFGATYELERHGEGNMYEPRPPPGEREWHFLSGVTERRDAIGLNLLYESIGRHLFSVSYRYASTRNTDNKLGKSFSSHTVQAKIGYGFRWGNRELQEGTGGNGEG